MYSFSFIFKGETYPSITSFRRMTIMNPEKWERCPKEYVNIILRDSVTDKIEFILKTQIIKLVHQTEEEMYLRILELSKNDQKPKETFEVQSIDRLLDLQKVDCDLTNLYLWTITKKQGKECLLPFSDDRIRKIADFIEFLIENQKEEEEQ